MLVQAVLESPEREVQITLEVVHLGELRRAIVTSSDAFRTVECLQSVIPSFHDPHTRGQSEIEIHFRCRAPLCIFHVAEQIKPARIVSDGFCMCGSGGGAIARALPVADGLLGLSSFGEVSRHDFRLEFRRIREFLAQDRSDAPMQRLARRAQQALVGHVLNQGVLEHTGRLAAGAAALDEPRCVELVERQFDFPRRLLANRAEQLVGELATERRSHLSDGFTHRQTVQPRHERILKGRRHIQRRTRRIPLGLEQCAGELLDEQRNAVGLGDDVGEHRLGEPGVLGDAIDQRARLAPIDATERYQAGIGLAGPGRLEARAAGYRHQ